MLEARKHLGDRQIERGVEITKAGENWKNECKMLVKAYEDRLFNFCFLFIM